MYKIYRLTWILRYAVLCFFNLRIPYNIIALGRPLVLIGFGKIMFSGRATIFPASRIEVFGAGLISIGKGVQIGQLCHITCAKSITLGNNVAIAGNAVITDISHGTKPIEIPPLKREWSVKEVIIGDNCFIGWGAVILPGTNLGAGCTVGANAKVSGSHKPGSVIV
jgi:acetyltransferase-like isoleucine patch superfamily enzyme